MLRIFKCTRKEKHKSINFISNNQNKFHIPGEKLIATKNLLQHQIPTKMIDL